MAAKIDLFLRILKWPIAALFLTLTPALILTFIAEVEAWKFNDRSFGFVYGLLAYAAADFLVFHRRAVGDAFSTLEHELTHAIFAWLTFHRVSQLRVTWNQGGSIMIHGGEGGNWLISIAPYWFPTLCIPFMIAISVIGTEGYWAAPALGAAFAYHHLTTWRETHAAQSDLQKTGLTFAWCFLPSANLLSAGMVIAFASDGWSNTQNVFFGAWDRYVVSMRWALDLLSIS